MSRFTPQQLTLLIVFCIYWFLLFPIIWFLIQPRLFVSDIWLSLLFAVFLFVVYCIIHTLIMCAFEMRAKRQMQHVKVKQKQPNGERRAVVEGEDIAMIEKPVAAIYHKPQKSPSLASTAEEASAPAANMASSDDENIDLRSSYFMPKQQQEQDETEVRFVSDVKLFYDGRKFRDPNTAVSKY